MQKFCSNCKKNTDINVKMNACLECGEIFPASAGFSSGTEIAGFRIDSELGRGGMGLFIRQLN